MMLDISVAAAKERAARWAASWEPAMGPAGVEKTRRQPVAFTDRQHRIVERFTRLVTPRRRRRDYRAAVEARLSATVGDAACTAACIAAATEGDYIANEVLAEHRLVVLAANGAVRSPTNERPPSWRSKAIMGVERKSKKRRKHR